MSARRKATTTTHRMNKDYLEEIRKIIRENNEKIRKLLIRAFTSKQEGRDISPVVRKQLEALEKILLKHKDRNQKLLKQIVDVLYDTVLVTVNDASDAKNSESHNTLLETVTKMTTTRATKRGSPSASRGGRKTRKNRGKKQKTQKRKQLNKKRKHTQRRKQTEKRKQHKKK